MNWFKHRSGRHITQTHTLPHQQSTRSKSTHTHRPHRRAVYAYARTFPKAFILDILRSWAHQWRRFTAIAMITMLGVAVLTGIYAGCMDAQRAVSRLYESQGLRDIQIFSTAGLTNDDVQALRELKEIATAQPEISTTMTTSMHGSIHDVTMHVIGNIGLDQPYVLRGSLPRSYAQVAVTEQFLADSGLHLGSSITLQHKSSTANAVTASTHAQATSESGTPATSETSTPQVEGIPTHATITAVVLDPADLENPQGFAAQNGFRSNGNDSYTMYISASGITSSIYTAISLKIQQSADTSNPFGASYEQAVRKVSDRIADHVQPQRERARERQLRKQAQAQLQSAQAQLNEQTQAQLPTTAQQTQQLAIPTVQWIIQTRSTMPTVNAFESDITAISSIGRVFPVVFLLVAVLISLTSMTRMVEEERTRIGTYTALGYSGTLVAQRYVLFALCACLVGGILGCLVGFLAIPSFLLTIIQGLYVIPNARLEFDWLYGGLGIALFFIGVVGATVWACVQALRSKPAVLMRPLAPKAGARIALERLPFLWKRMSFIAKVTARNIFRFKSRMFMTVGGVAGCTALMICGFAIQDTVGLLGAVQYQHINHYDILTVASDRDATAMHTKLQQDNRVQRHLDARVEQAQVVANNQYSSAVQLNIIPQKQLSTLSSMVELRKLVNPLYSPSSGPLVQLQDDGIIIDASAAHSLHVHQGDTVALTSASGKRASVHIDAVVRNLVGTNVYMSQNLYTTHFVHQTDSSANTAEYSNTSNTSAPNSSSTNNSAGNSTESTINSSTATTPSIIWNAQFSKISGDTESKIRYGDSLTTASWAVQIVSCPKLAQTLKFDLMGAVVAVTIGLAVGLAIIVLATLSSTNVSERTREVATLKVLGFYNHEIHRYINREMFILTCMGIGFGLVAGYGIAQLLTLALRMPAIYFEVHVQWYSYCLATAITLLFSIIIQIITHKTLNAVDQVSSLKSVE